MEQSFDTSVCLAVLSKSFQMLLSADLASHFNKNNKRECSFRNMYFCDFLAEILYCSNCSIFITQNAFISSLL